MLGQIRSRRITAIILIARWRISAFGIDPYERDIDTAPVLLSDATTTARSEAQNWPIFRRGLERTLRALRALHGATYMMIDVPDPDIDVPSFLARRANAGATDATVWRDFDTMQGYRQLNAFFARLRDEFNVSVIDPASALCEGTRCLLAADGRALYVDHQHLSVAGARLLEPLFRPVFAELRRQSSGNHE
jgi:hypothetical protein